MAEPLKPIKISNFSTNEKLVEQIYTLTKPLYFDNTTLLEREINRCNDIYLVKNDVQLIAFFMVNFEKVDEIDTFYLGLSSCHPDFQSKGFAKLLYLTFFLDCVTMEKELNKKIICWWTTATPVAYLWFNKNIDKVEPNLDGEISSEGHNVILKIISSKYSGQNIDLQTPFILPGIAKNTKYSLAERNRLKKITDDLRLPAFVKHQIDETKGDRFLMIGYAPTKNVLIEKLNKVNNNNRTHN
jgi:hypothetical protein